MADEEPTVPVETTEPTAAESTGETAAPVEPQQGSENDAVAPPQTEELAPTDAPAPAPEAENTEIGATEDGPASTDRPSAENSAPSVSAIETLQAASPPLRGDEEAEGAGDADDLDIHEEEEEKNSLEGLNVLQCVEWLREKIRLHGGLVVDSSASNSELTEDLRREMVEFVMSETERRLFAFNDPESKHLKTTTAVPPDTIPSFFYFVRKANVRRLTPDNISESVQFGRINCSGVESMHSLLRVMTSLYVPLVQENKTWPESFRKDFSGQLHKFMASLTETAYELRGSTVLYVPLVDVSNKEVAAKDKDLVQDLESTLIYWTRQIKEVVNNQDNSEHSEDAGPLSEIQFWRSRAVDLSGIRDQLQRAEVLAIVDVLTLAKSSYLDPFNNLAQSIEHGSLEAQDNLKFLSTLTEPCEKLAKSEPKEIPALLPGVLNLVRMIWSLSRHYNTPERLTGLLRQISNEIIERCCAKINLNDIFDGNVEIGVKVLQESIKSGEDWKGIYHKTAKLVGENSTNPWNFDESRIFAQIDAFVQRCRDLLEVCESQIQFSQKHGAEDNVAFGGAKGAEIAKSLVDIQGSFDRLIHNLRSLNYNILDVKATRWHDDYNAFKNGVKDLEVMMQNVISIAFESVSTVSTGVDMLEAFYHLAKREHIKRAIEKKIAHVFEIFQRDLNAIKKEFDQRRNPPRYHLHPNYSGACFWAKGLSRRLEKETALLSSTYYLVSSREYEDALNQSNQLNLALEEYMKKMYSDWLTTIDENHSKKLENNLLMQPTSAGYLEHNFGKELLRLFDEVRLWEKLRAAIPYVAMEMASQRDKFRVIKENVNLVVRDYNQILYSLSMPERRLFQEKLATLNRKITPGLTRLTWLSRSIVEFYVKDCRRHCKEMFSLVNNFKANNEKVLKLCRVISDTLLIKIEKKRIYEEGAFEATQAEHRSVVREKLQQCHGEVKHLMAESYDVFGTDGEEIQREWQRYVIKTDQVVEDALRTTVKRSLQEIARAINGDARTEVHPIFKVNVVLDRDKVEFKPTMSNLTQMVNFVSKELITVVSVVPCLRGTSGHPTANDKAGVDDQGAPTSFYVRISNDEDILKIMVSIMGGMSSSLDKLQKYLTFWEKYKHIWDHDKDAFIRRYAKANRPLSAFDTDIMKYKDYQTEIQNEETVVNMNFISIDCSPLKQALVAHCVGWQNKFTSLLHTNAITELKELHNIYQSNTAKLKKPPTTLDMLSDGIILVKKLQGESSAIEARFDPLNAHFKLLEKFDVAVKEDELELVATLQPEFVKFKQLLNESTRTLDSFKEKFKGNLINQLQEFNKHITDARTEFSQKGPFDVELKPEDALNQVSKYRGEIEKDRDKENKMRSGVDLFGLERPVYKLMEKTEKDLELLDAIWTVTQDWNNSWDIWKTGKFRDLDTSSMEEAAAKFNKRLQKLSKEIKHWRTWDALKERVDQFKRTMPLISDLRNEALRDRHWLQLMDEIGKSFDPKGDDFTLEKVFTLGLDQHATTISNISSYSSKELMIEKTLDTIQGTWNDLTLDLAKYKEFQKVRSTDAIYEALEEQQLSLLTMKTSRFAVPFLPQIERWERSLSHVSETIECLMNVQQAWMYLENIFIGSDDIRRQLPQETATFDSVNSNWKLVMDQLSSEGNVMRGTHIDGLKEMLESMATKLEKIQKSLDQYLETKRQAFPRFYFLSNDDLLEILGQARDPMAVQPHLKKCFEAIRSLKMEAPGREGRRSYEAHAMISPESEYVPFITPIVADGQVELWLIEVESGMRLSLRKMLFQTLSSLRGSKREKWIKDWPGQLQITAGQISWTNDSEKALGDVEKGNKNALRLMKKKQISMLAKYSDMVRGQLSKLDRLKLIGIVTIEVHARDVIDRMIKAGCNSISDFEWISQLRFYWDKDADDCLVRQTQATFNYGHEYLGNSGRLVITPLTDRCYNTLTNALHLKRGGNPLGPAGTGKTETVKDLGKAIAKYVIVFNCSDGLDYKSLGRFFSGICQCGAWSCLDEFNRIDIEVLSVVAQQLLAILSAITEKQDHFKFEGTMIRLDRSCGIFVTMNPGYAGRSELPDNLKALLRPVSMMVPDISLIAEIMFFSEGFVNAKILSKKIASMYSLMMQQLSKQDHYDWGLRAIKAVLNSSGQVKRSDPETQEEIILLRTLRDMNVPKLVPADLVLFNALIQDLFPGVEPPTVDYGALQLAIKEDLEKMGLQPNPNLITKCIQVYETKLTRHGNMLVGQTNAGKTVAWRTLANAMTKLKKENAPNMEAVRQYIINPKSLSLGELYGEYNLVSREWADGVLSSVMRIACADEKPDQKWIILDGPVDTLWIESMNTVLDDNKLLTLISGERIAMPPQVRLLFEVQDLAVASPATVSRAGMVYFDPLDLGWQPYIETWLGKRNEPESAEHLRRLIEKYVAKTLDYKTSDCHELIPVSPLCAVQGLTRLFDAVGTVENGIDISEPEHYVKMIEMWFAFCVVWSLGGSVDEEGRRKMDVFFREIDAQFPSRNTVYDYCVDTKKKQWIPWTERLNATWRPLPDTSFYKILVPTVDSLRNAFVLGALCRKNENIMITGVVGAGKTSLIQQVLAGLDEAFVTLMMQFSNQTTSNKVQEIVEGKVEKRTKDVFAPPGGKLMICFIDDCNMPAKDVFGSMPPIELLRLWMEHGFWFDRARQVPKFVKDVQLICAGGPPGGGRSQLPTRFVSKFCHMNFTFPDDVEVKRIFGTMINLKLTEFDDDIKPLGDIMTQATLEIYQTVSTELLPTPTKSHYVFNMRDMSKVFQGVLQATRDFFDSRDSMTRLWVHECFRVFHDRLVDQDDRNWFKKLVEDKLSNLFTTTWKALFKGQALTMFCDFVREGMDSPPYEEVTDVAALKQIVEEKLEEYNTEPGLVAMNLVMFRDALEHVVRISRIIKLPRGHALLVGMGGSGRQSLAKLTVYIQGFTSFQIEISRTYGQENFRDDIKKLFYNSGVLNKPTVFIFADTQIVHEGFLEDINSLLGSGEVPNLYAQDELASIREGVRVDAKKAGIPETPDALMAFFMDRCRENLHLILCMSPIGEAFRQRLRKYPNLLNCVTLDWFSEWPADALKEVAMKFLGGVDLGSAEISAAVADTFKVVQKSVLTLSEKMLLQMKRHNYVTPTNYLELVQGYLQLVKEKRKLLGDNVDKLRNGILKLDESRKQVQEMSIELEEKKKQVAVSQKDCEELLVVIVQDRRTVDEQAKQVEAESEKLMQETAALKIVQEDAQRDLDEALPALNAAEESLKTLNKRDIAEIKAYTKAPDLVELTMQAVLTLKKSSSLDWAEAKKQLGDPNFLVTLSEYNKDELNDALLHKVKKFVENEKFVPAEVGKQSGAARSLCLWVHAMYKFGKIAKVVAPKKEKLRVSEEIFAKKQENLKNQQRMLQEVRDRMQALKAQYDDSVGTKDRLKKESEDLETKLERAQQLVSGLAGERERWLNKAASLDVDILNLPGDCCIASAFLSYAGFFNSEYRREMVDEIWSPHVRQLAIPCTENFNFNLFLANPTDVRDWNIQGLPTDSFSTENGVLVTRGRRWPLMIDPQQQANKWIKNLEAKNSLKVMDFKISDWMRHMENCIQFGTPVLMQDILEELDPALEPVLGKSITKKGNSLMIKLGDKELDYNPDFRFYLTTKLHNPHYTPEVSTKCTMVNFAVKEEGLENQVLGLAVRKERPDLEEKKSELTRKLAEDKRTLVEMEDKILFLLSSATGSLLDDEKLVMTLQTSKTTAEEVTAQLIVAEQTEKNIDIAREAYRQCAVRSALLYFVINDLGVIDPMYQFSLDFYFELFSQSIDKSVKNENLDERIKNLNQYHTFAVYRTICRSLFEKHKLLFSLQMCVKIMQRSNKINREEYGFFLRGGAVLDRTSQSPNPAPEWITENAWDNISELEKLPNFRNVVTSFEQNSSEWRIWYQSAEPETSTLPGEWENKCNELQRLILLRCLRADRLVFAITTFVVSNLGPKFVEPPPFELDSIYADSAPTTPLIFILSPGVDPVITMQSFASKLGMGDKFFMLALGQGQGPVAMKLLTEGIQKGHWIFLANCHLCISFMPDLEKFFENLPSRRPHKSFRLWLSSNPHPKFPISILQGGIKMTSEPPRGLKSNLTRIYNRIDEPTFSRCAKPHKYKKLLFGLCYFHSVLLERRKFMHLGWNIPYDFNDSDFDICENILVLYIESYEETPWESLKYLIAEANYGGRVTDDWDRRLMLSYINQFMCPDAIATANFKMSTLPTYYIPDDGALQSYKDHIMALPNFDAPEAFGQHGNADIASQIEGSNALLQAVLSMQPSLSTSAGESSEDKVMTICTNMLAQVPPLINLKEVIDLKSDDPSALHTVLFQEIERYNDLLRLLSTTLGSLQRAIKGLMVMTPELDEVFGFLLDGRVPLVWNKAYPSLKPLASWTRDMQLRVEQLSVWSQETYPRVYWMSGFTFPTGFLTAVLQTCARKNNISIDMLSWEFVVVNQLEKDIQQGPKEGVYVKGLFLEGAGWNHDHGVLAEPNPMELVVAMPILHLKPVESKKKFNKGMYSCPCYYFPVRTGTRERPSFILAVDLKSGNSEPDHWIKRGTALLCSLAF